MSIQLKTQHPSNIKTVKDLRFYSDAIPYLFNINDQPITLENHKPWIYFYDNSARVAVVRSGRQVTKSTNVAASTLVRSISKIGFNTLYLSPLKSQTEIWSHKKLNKLKNDSPVIAQYIDGNCIDQVLQKTFSTGSTINLSYYRTDPSRIRGDSNDLIIFDEVQNMDLVGMDVVEEAQSASEYQEVMYVGTALGMDNTLEFLFNKSNQCVWVVPCKACKSYNKLDLDNVGVDGLICKKCGKPIHNRDGFFVATKDSPILGLHIPQLAVDHIITGTLIDGTRKWDIFKQKLESRTDKIIYNEMLGLPYGTGQRSITIEKLRSLVEPYEIKKHLRERELAQFQVVCSGVDYSGGGGEVKADGSQVGGESLHAYVTVGVTEDNRFKVLNFGTYPGVDTEAVMKIGKELIPMQSLLIMGDGSGSTGNNNMLRLCMPNVGIHDFMYRKTSTCTFKPPHKFIGARTVLIDYIMDLLNNGRIIFPSSKMTEDFFEHILAEYQDDIYGKDNLDIIDHEWLRSPNKPDDLLQALVMAVYACHVARADIGLQLKDIFLYNRTNY